MVGWLVGAEGGGGGVVRCAEPLSGATALLGFRLATGLIAAGNPGEGVVPTPGLTKESASGALGCRRGGSLRRAFVGRCRAARLPPRHRTHCGGALRFAEPLSGAAAPLGFRLATGLIAAGNPGEGVVPTPGLTKESASGALG